MYKLYDKENNHSQLIDFARPGSFIDLFHQINSP